MSTPHTSPPKASFLPLYQQVKDALLKRIAAGEWPPGTFLPNEFDLARDYGVSQGTLRKALNELAAERRVVRYQGKGTAVPTFDADQNLFRFFHLVRDGGRRELPLSRLVAARTAAATRDQAADLDIRPGSPVYRIDRVRLLDDTPVINERLILPCARFPGIEAIGAANLPNTLYDLFQKRFGVTIAQAVERLKAVPADAADAKRLGVPAGHPLLSIRRVALDLQSVPVELRVSNCRTDGYSYLSELR
jgi:GntR family transcriptional regulator